MAAAYPGFALTTSARHSGTGRSLPYLALLTAPLSGCRIPWRCAHQFSQTHGRSRCATQAAAPLLSTPLPPHQPPLPSPSRSPLWPMPTLGPRLPLQPDTRAQQMRHANCCAPPLHPSTPTFIPTPFPLQVAPLAAAYPGSALTTSAGHTGATDAPRKLLRTAGNPIKMPGILPDTLMRMRSPKLDEQVCVCVVCSVKCLWEGDEWRRRGRSRCGGVEGGN